jgi:hypothetical protein
LKIPDFFVLAGKTVEIRVAFKPSVLIINFGLSKLHITNDFSYVGSLDLSENTQATIRQESDFLPIYIHTGIGAITPGINPGLVYALLPVCSKNLRGFL